MSQTNPKKIVINTSEDLESILKTAQEAIIVNLYANPDFNGFHVFDILAVKKFVEILKIKPKEFNEDFELKITYLVHLSKCMLRIIDFETSFGNIDSFRVARYNDSDFNLRDLFSKIKQNKIILKAITSTIEDLTEYSIEDVDLNRIQLVFFESNIFRLNGVAGISKVFMSLSSFENFLQKMVSNKFNQENKKLMARLYFIRLIVHELVHVVNRDRKKDLNTSSPKMSDFHSLKLKDEEFKDAGIIAEKKIFSQRIDFFESINQYHALNFQYIASFYDDLIEKEMDVKFDVLKSRMIPSSTVPCMMGIDMDFEKNSFTFE
ncbi:unnamed protein product [Brachionus calyciflorus]|uniref:Uncharacterized protein n=1 Tax=Brachionus calyciflorus TaxID=104777 RepID=A0A814BPE9_9BILA|nr:unnamed protein product [Brachionus calyciflorus]